MNCSAAKIGGIALLCAILGACAGSPEARRDKFLAKGKEYLQKRDYARALLEFHNAGQAKPNDAEVFYQLGAAYIQTGDLRSAVLNLRKALVLNPKHRQAQIALAQLMAGANDPTTVQDANQRLRTLLNEGPADATMLNTLALTQLKLKDVAGATETLDRAVAEFPQVSSFFMLARVRWDQNDFKGAEDALKKACIQLPKSADAHRILADFYVAQKRLPEAESEIRRAIELNPKDGLALNALARLLLAQGKKPEAEQTFRQLSGLDGYKTTYGLFLFQDGRRDEAVREFERVARENSNDIQARTYLLAAYRAVNRNADIDRVLAEAIQKNHHDIEALQQRAEIFIERGKYPEAETDLNQVIKIDPQVPQVYYLRARLHLLRGEKNSYRQDLTEALRLNSLLLAVRFELAQEYINNKAAQAAIDLLDGAPPFQKSSVEFILARNWALWAKGDMAEMRKGIDSGLAKGRTPGFLIQDGIWKLRAGNSAGAVKSLEEALNSDPGNSIALEALNSAYAAQKNSATGRQKVKEYAAKAPNSAPAQEYLGTISLANGEIAQARSAFTAAESLAPQSLNPQLGLAQVDYAEHKYPDGEARLKKLLAANPGNLTAYLWLGIFEQATGDYKPAIEHFRKVVDSNPNEPQASNNLAYLLAEHENDLNEALKYAQKAVELAPSSAAYSDTLGWVLYRKGLYSSAVKYLEQATAHPGTVVWKYHLAMAYAKAGDQQRSRATLDSALKVNPNVPEAKLAQEIVGQSH